MPRAVDGRGVGEKRDPERGAAEPGNGRDGVSRSGRRNGEHRLFPFEGPGGLLKSKTVKSPRGLRGHPEDSPIAAAFTRQRKLPLWDTTAHAEGALARPVPSLPGGRRQPDGSDVEQRLEDVDTAVLDDAASHT